MVRLAVVVIAADGSISIHAPRTGFFHSVRTAELWATREFGPDGADSISWTVEPVAVAG